MLPLAEAVSTKPDAQLWAQDAATSASYTASLFDKTIELVHIEFLSDDVTDLEHLICQLIGLDVFR